MKMICLMTNFDILVVDKNARPGAAYSIRGSRPWSPPAWSDRPCSCDQPRKGEPLNLISFIVNATQSNSHRHTQFTQKTSKQCKINFIDVKYSKCKMSKNLGRDGAGAVEGDDEAEKCDEKHKCLLSG